MAQNAAAAAPTSIATGPPPAAAESGILPTPALQGRPDYIAGVSDAAEVQVHRGRGLRSPKPWHKQYVGRSPPTYAPPSLRPPPLGPPSFPPPATHLAADANPFAQRLPFPSKTASGIYHVPAPALPPHIASASQGWQPALAMTAAPPPLQPGAGSFGLPRLGNAAGGDATFAAKQAAPGLARLNQQLAAQASTFQCSKTKGSFSQIGSRLYMDERGSLWLLPASAAPSMAASKVPGSRTAAPNPAAPLFGQAAVPESAANATWPPQSIGTAAAIIENGGVPASAAQTAHNADGWGAPLHEALAEPGQDFGFCKRDIGDPGGPWVFRRGLCGCPEHSDEHYADAGAVLPADSPGPISAELNSGSGAAMQFDAPNATSFSLRDWVNVQPEPATVAETAEMTGLAAAAGANSVKSAQLNAAAAPGAQQRHQAAAAAQQGVPAGDTALLTSYLPAATAEAPAAQYQGRGSTHMTIPRGTSDGDPAASAAGKPPGQLAPPNSPANGDGGVLTGGNTVSKQAAGARAAAAGAHLQRMLQAGHYVK